MYVHKMNARARAQTRVLALALELALSAHAHVPIYTTVSVCAIYTGPPCMCKKRAI